MKCIWKGGGWLKGRVEGVGKGRGVKGMGVKRDGE